MPKWCRECAPKRPPIRPTVRRAVYERDGWRCGICQDPVDADLIGSRSMWRPSLDHIVPHIEGGTDDPDNLRLAHFWCNSIRGAALYEDEVFRVA